MIVYPLLFLLNLILIPGGLVLLVLSSRNSTSRGRCAACGYDVRASLQRCPECGLLRDQARSSGPTLAQRLLRVLGIVSMAIPLLCDAAVITVLVSLLIQADWPSPP